MQLSVRPYATAGIAIVGASVIVATPAVAPPPTEVVRSAEVTLAAQALPSTGQAFAGLLANLGSGLGPVIPSPTGAVGIVPGPSTPSQIILAALQQIGTNLTDWVNAAPGNLQALVQAVAANPSQLPNALSALAYMVFYLPPLATPIPNTAPTAAIGVFAPRSLLASVVLPIVRALNQILPPPLGGGSPGTTFGNPGSPSLVLTAYTALAKVVDGVLARLPTPLPTPTPYGPPPTTFAATTTVAAATTVAQSVTTSPVTTPVTRVAAQTGSRTPRFVKLAIPNTTANTSTVAAGITRSVSTTNAAATSASTVNQTTKATALTSRRLATGGGGGRHRAG